MRCFPTGPLLQSLGNVCGICLEGTNPFILRNLQLLDETIRGGLSADPFPLFHPSKGKKGTMVEPIQLNP